MSPTPGFDPGSRRAAWEGPLHDVAEIRAHFPFYDTEGEGRRIAYLDNAATTQRPRVMIEALAHFYAKGNANVRRGVHRLSREATADFENARRKVAAFFGVADPRRVAFTRNATESLNLLAYTLPSSGAGSLCVTDHEHHANFIPWQEAARRQALPFHVVKLPLDRPATIDDIAAQTDAPPQIIAVSRMSNATGMLAPIEDIVTWAHGLGSKVVVDLAQAAAHERISFDELGADFGALSAHKCYGPFGIGVLLAAPGSLDDLPPFLTGGEMIDEVGLDRSTWANPPTRFEAGTPDAAGALAFAATLDFLETLDWEAARRHELELVSLVHETLSVHPSVQIIGTRHPNEKSALVTLAFDTQDPHEIAMALDSMDIAVRAGDHCARPLHQALQIPATLRASFAIYNTREETERFLETLSEILTIC